MTHLHSDHTAGYSDLILTGWTAGRRVPLEVYGPPGLLPMTEHILQAYRVDIEARTNPEGLQHGMSNGWKVNAHEIRPGVIYEDANVTVTAFPTKHAVLSYGYRFDTPGRSIVISGDTNPTQETIKACNGCDVLIHEAQTLDWLAKLPEDHRSFIAKYLTTSEQLAALASSARPKLLIITHRSITWRSEIAAPGAQTLVISSGAFHSSPGVLEKEIASRYSGRFVIGRDLDVY